jgi:hypothetical protein
MLKRYIQLSNKVIENKTVRRKSRKILTLLKIIRLMDEKTCENYSILKQQRIGIDSKLLEILPINKSKNIETVQHIAEYIKEKNRCTPYPGLLDETYVGENSFGARFAKGIYFVFFYPLLAFAPIALELPSQ